MNRNTKISIIVIAGTLLMLTAWGAETKEVYKATIDNSGVQKIEMLAGSYFFRPNDVVVKVKRVVDNAYVIKDK